MDPVGLNGITFENEIHINKSESKDVKLFLDINKDTPVNLYKLEIKASSNSGLEKNITINLIIKEQMINSNESSGNNTNLLIIMGFIVIIIVIFLLVFLFLFKRKKRNEDGPKEIPQNIIKRESGPKGPE
jgi:ATP-dependent Zn protease